MGHFPENVKSQAGLLCPSGLYDTTIYSWEQGELEYYSGTTLAKRFFRAVRREVRRKQTEKEPAEARSGRLNKI
jgi:hypothetical protein